MVCKLVLRRIERSAIPFVRNASIEAECLPDEIARGSPLHNSHLLQQSSEHDLAVRGAAYQPSGADPLCRSGR